VGTRKIVVLGTGGTIAGKAAQAGDNVGYVAGQVPVEALLGGVGIPAGCTVQAEQVAQVDSKDMDHAIWHALAQRCAHWLAQADVCGVVVTHGTDTMEETAYFLQAVLAPGKPVVLTGAMRPATALVPDGPGNIADALAVAATPGAQGVVVVFAGSVHAAADVAKRHTYRTDAFSSGDAGVLAHVEEGALRQLRPWPAAGASARIASSLPGLAQWPRVEILFSHAGADGAIVDALVANGVRGIVVAATGNGTVHHALEAALVRARAAGVRVLRSTRCAEGRVLPHGNAALPHTSLSPVKARIALMLELAT
jgi:L-asparaginase